MNFVDFYFGVNFGDLNFGDFYFGDFYFGENDPVQTVPPPPGLWRDRFYRRLRARLRLQQWSSDPPPKRRMPGL